MKQPYQLHIGKHPSQLEQLHVQMNISLGIQDLGLPLALELKDF